MNTIFFLRPIIFDIASIGCHLSYMVLQNKYYINPSYHSQCTTFTSLKFNKYIVPWKQGGSKDESKKKRLLLLVATLATKKTEINGSKIIFGFAAKAAIVLLQVLYGPLIRHQIQNHVLASISSLVASACIFLIDMTSLIEVVKIKFLSLFTNFVYIVFLKHVFQKIPFHLQWYWLHLQIIKPTVDSRPLLTNLSH